jgi:hypothetical protein
VLEAKIVKYRCYCYVTLFDIEVSVGMSIKLMGEWMVILITELLDG